MGAAVDRRLVAVRNLVVLWCVRYKTRVRRVRTITCGRWLGVACALIDWVREGQERSEGTHLLQEVARKGHELRRKRVT